MARRVKRRERISKLSRTTKKALQDMSTRSRRRKKPEGPAPVVDVKWFQERRRTLDIQQKDVAEALGRSPALITRALKGERTLDAKDVAGLAAIFRVSTDEILGRLGFNVVPTNISIVGRVLGDGRISHVFSRMGEKVAVPAAPPKAEAIVAETEGTPLAPFSGAIFVYVRSSVEKPVPPDTFGRLCIIEAEGQVVPLLATMGRAPERGKVLLEVFQTGEKISASAVLRASAVLQIIFP